MNTPLNDALKNLADAAERQLRGEISPVAHCIRQARALLANTPESSAAQGAMGDAHLVPLHTFLSAAAGEGLVFDGVDAGDLYKSIFANRNNDDAFRIGFKGAQPSDATAQPRVDLTDERAASLFKEVMQHYSIGAGGIHVFELPTELYEQVKSFGILANTAQGKPEQDAAINLALEWDQSRKYIMPYIIRDALRAALAAKKG